MRSELPLAIILCAGIFGAGISSAGAGGTAATSSLRAGMPATVTLGSLASEYEPVSFDHAAHVEEADGCGQCHHRHDTGREAGCRGCHSPDAPARAVRASTVRSCGTCHPAVLSRSDLSRPALKAAYHRACFRCHREVGSVGEDPKGCTEMCHARTPSREAFHGKDTDTIPGTAAR